MEHLNKKEEICRKVAENFRYAGKITKMSPYGSGHINDTFMLTCELEDGSNKHYILQRMNDDIFRNPQSFFFLYYIVSTAHSIISPFAMSRLRLFPLSCAHYITFVLPIRTFSQPSLNSPV